MPTWLVGPDDFKEVNARNKMEAGQKAWQSIATHWQFAALNTASRFFPFANVLLPHQIKTLRSRLKRRRGQGRRQTREIERARTLDCDQHFRQI